MNKNELNNSIDRISKQLGPLSIIITVYGFPLTVLALLISILSLFHFEITFNTSVNTVHIVLLVVFSMLFLVFILNRRWKIKRYTQAWKTYLKIQRSILKEQNKNDCNSIEKYVNDQINICNSTSEILYKLTGRKVSVSIKVNESANGTTRTRLLCKSLSSTVDLCRDDYPNEAEFQAIIGGLLSQKVKSGDEYDFVWVNNEILNKYQISITENDCYKSTAVLPILHNDAIYAYLCIEGLKKRDLNDFFTNHILLSLSITLSLTTKNIYKKMNKKKK